MILTTSLFLFSLLFTSIVVYNTFHTPVIKYSLYVDKYIKLNNYPITDNKMIHITSEYYKPYREVILSNNTEIDIQDYFEYLLCNILYHFSRFFAN